MTISSANRPAGRASPVASSTGGTSLASLVGGGVPGLLGAAVAVLGIVVIAGWLADVEPLKQVLPGAVSMKFNTAVGFVLVGLGLWRRATGRPEAATRAAAALVVALAAATLAEHAWDIDLGIDELVIADDTAGIATAAPGRMAPATAFLFVLTGLALVVMRTPAPPRRRGYLLFLLPVLAAALLVLYGYLYGVSSLTTLASGTAMAVHTAVAFLVAGLGMVGLHPPLRAALGADRPSGRLVRRLLVASVIMPAVIVTTILAGLRAGFFGLEMAASLGAVLVGGAMTAGVIAAVRPLIREEQDARTARIAAEEAATRMAGLNEELERRVRDRTAELEATVGELEAYSYSVAHDLRAPVRAIDGFAALLEQSSATALDEEGIRRLAIIRSSAVELSGMIDGLLAFSKLARQPIESPSIVDLAAVARAAWRDLAAGRGGRPVELVLGTLPAAMGEAALLRRVLTNLLDNALKFSRDRDPARIEVGAEPAPDADGRIVYFVRDNGVGFDPQYADRLFGIFQRLHRVDEFEGTGIGLASVRRIVARHGGRVWATARPGEGATFSFTLEAA